MNAAATETLYYRFLKLRQSVNTLPAGVALSPVEALLLEEIVLKQQAHQPMTVSEAIELSHLASPSTLHKKLSRLKSMALLTTENRDNDHRTKYLVLTPIAEEYFRALGKALQKAVDKPTRIA
ncbi:hypothetical protein B9Z38_02955 [Limnohabitans sp. MMS-10A-160]|jgi:DNA-binding MarR family transcriptional regulator|uniref:hypothetical protein n=1 Tax=unclassified Limnohabitans TaxID=2626134 RepID=UPI000D363FE0|nr:MULTISPECIES: hypothetical protein [unclassified Limnohabitans]PUE18027.1 hypothetical protein B9Z43_12750 [Limnohabitans sp. MMS-10A-192]PUE27255.1 hypothetical protein B9Z38_02955 [Limnohabitans sp. MMS-10A-160]